MRCNATLGPFGLCKRDAGHSGSHWTAPPYVYPPEAARELQEELAAVDARGGNLDEYLDVRGRAQMCRCVMLPF